MPVVTDESDAALVQAARDVLRTENRLDRAPDRLVLSAQQVAWALNCSLPTAYKLIYDGELRSFMLGGMRKVAYADLLAYLEMKRNEQPRRKVVAWAKKPIKSPAEVAERRDRGRPRGKVKTAGKAR